MPSKTFEKVIGIIGNPTNPDITWSNQQLSSIRNIGVDTLQLSIAWSSKPANEVLNMEDLDDSYVYSIYKERVKKSHEFGFSALAHFGIPYTSNQQFPACIMEPEVVKNYSRRLEKFFIESHADEVMVYTYDQRAWLCSEFGDCHNCKDIPLHQRLIPFLEALTNAVQNAKSSAMFWWEPWELSEGQIIAVIEGINVKNFGIIAHSNIGEVNFINTVDLPSRNIARLAKARGIPFISEGFFSGSGEDIAGLTHMPCPRLVYQQLDSMHRTHGLTGIKEYYGFVPADFSVNISLFNLYLQSPETNLNQLLFEVANEYGEKEPILEAWEMAAQGMELFPYNASWWLRFIISSLDTQNWKRLKSADWETPSWKSSRRAYYMITNESEQHPWLLEDVNLRANAAGQRFKEAARLLGQAQIIPGKIRDIQAQKRDLTMLSAAAYKFAQSIK